MVGFDEVAMGDWMMPPTPSPRTIFSSITSDGNVGTGCENTNMSLFPGPEGRRGMFGDADQKDENHTSAEGNDEASISNAPAGPKTGSRGGLLERRAGFNAPKLNTGSIRPADLSTNLEIRSPGFAVSPGFSPTLLLESPVFLSNSLVLPSPTTGKFFLGPSGNYQNPISITDDSHKGKEITHEDVSDSSFAFKPVAESSSFPYFNTVNKANPSGFAPQSFAGAVFSFPSNTPVSNQSLGSHSQSQSSGSKFQPANFSESNMETNRNNIHNSEKTYNGTTGSENSPPLDEIQEDDGDQRSGGEANIGNGPAEDGYNWRKYGQKQVKGSEYPRSYYKCTHTNCPVKKKVERSHEGHITEIIYKGAHNHPKPPPNRRPAVGSSSGLGDVQLNSEQIGTDANGGLPWSNMQNGNEEYGNGAANLQGPSGVKYETVDGADGTSAFSNDEDDDDRATHGSASLGYDGEGDESESKRRKIESYASDLTGASRAIREPRVVVQTTSEVDILDDGYRWRKYGQKVVKGNPNPRSYYKCTSTGCNVRKHVERACHDLKSVITTYEGKHNHDVPAARNSSSHLNAGGASFPTQQATSAASTQIHRPEPSQIRGRMPQLGSFGLQNRSQLGPGAGFGYGMNSQAGLAGLGMARLGPNQGKFPINPYLGHHQAGGMNDMSLMVPKDEPEAVAESGSNTGASNQAMLYQQYMNRLPLGPQM